MKFKPGLVSIQHAPLTETGGIGRHGPIVPGPAVWDEDGEGGPAILRLRISRAKTAKGIHGSRINASIPLIAQVQIGPCGHIGAPVALHADRDFEKGLGIASAGGIAREILKIRNIAI